MTCEQATHLYLFCKTMVKERTVFITGVTGLVGSYITKVFLENGHRVYALARPKDEQGAQQRVGDILKFWNEKILDEYGSNLIVIEGDITKPNLGLTIIERDVLKNEIEEIFHCAAATQLNLPLAELRFINVEGTRHVLELGYEWNKNGKLKKVNYFSTAYVCGDYEGIFKEGDLEIGQKLHTSYEQSKFEAEKLVKAYRKKGLWIDIFRPAAVTGESATGRTFKFEHIYELLYLWSLDVLDFFPNEESFSIDFACIDHIAQAILSIFNNSNMKNETYHLFGEKPFFTKDIFQLARTYIGFKKTSLVTWEEFNKKEISPTQRKIINKINAFNVVLQTKLDSAQTRHILKNKCNFIFPIFTSEHFSNILRYVVQSGFIKKRRKKNTHSLTALPQQENR